MIKKVLEILKSKTQSFGFNKEELKSVAEIIVEQLDIDEEASDEDVEAEITKAVNQYLPFIQLSQSMATRVINKKLSPKKDDNKDDDKKDEDVNKEDDKDDKSSKSDKDKDEKEPEWAKALKEMSETIKTLTSTIDGMKQEKKTQSREERLSELLKDAGAYGNSIMRNFKRMSFDSDESFEEFFTETEDELADFLKEQKDNSKQDNLSKPPRARVFGGDRNKKEVLTDNEIEALADVL